MGRRYGWKFALIMLVVLLLGIGGWFFSRQFGPEPQPPPPPAQSDAANRAPKAAPVLAPPPVVPSLGGPLKDTIERIQAQQSAGPSASFQAKRDALERTAAAGDANAAAELGELMLLCESYVDFGEQDLEALLVEGIATFGKESLKLPESMPLDMVLDSANHAFAHMRKTCDGADGLELTADERRRALDLLRQGARAGNTDAMSNFALYAFADFADRRAMIADPQAVRERKREARQYLDRAIAAGNIEALWTAANAHEEGAFLEKSRILAYANFYAYRQASLRNGVEARVLDTELALFAVDLTPQQIAEARRRGDAIYAACCRPKGDGS